MILYPAILTDSIEELQAQIDLVSPFSEIELVQIDIIDGLFTDNLTVTPADLLDVDFGRLKIDFHLMVEEPLNYLYEILDWQKQLPIRSVIAQIERMTHPVEFVSKARSSQLEPGLSLDLFTPIDEIEPALLAKLDRVQLMAIEAGEQGKHLQPLIFSKLTALSQQAKQHNPELEIVVDGGVKLTNVAKLKEHGASAVAVGSQIWKSEQPAEVIRSLVQQ